MEETEKDINWLSKEQREGRSCRQSGDFMKTRDSRDWFRPYKIAIDKKFVENDVACQRTLKK